MWRVRGVLRDYDWGPVDGLAAWCAPTGGPQAELWFGVHPAAPAPLVDDEGCDTGASLADVLPRQRRVLLVKLLAAARPLSIQVHPAAGQAAALFAGGLLPDDQAKIETLTALTPFRVHVGWRPAAQVHAAWAAAGVPPAALGTVNEPTVAVRAAFGLPTEVLTEVVPRLADAAAAAGFDAEATRTLREVATLFPADPGVLVCALMGHALLGAGDVVGVLPGVIHSYVAGLGVEVMTSSDNVLRLGLTSKAVALDDALAALDVDGAAAVPPDARFPFETRIAGEGISVAPHGYRVVLCLEGSVEVACGPGRRAAPVGQAIVIAESEPPAEVLIRGRAAIVGGR